MPWWFWVLAFAVILPPMIRMGGRAGGPRRCDRITSMMAMELAGSVAKAELILTEWQQATRLDRRRLDDQLRKAILYDFAFIPLYASALGLACLAVAAAAREGELSWRLARILAWSQLVAAALDVLENLALWRMTSGRLESPWPCVARLCALPKFVIVIAGILFVLVAAGILIARRLRQPPEEWPAPLLFTVPLGNWILSYPVLLGVAVLLLCITWRIWLGTLGIPDLFWHHFGRYRFLAGLGAGLLAADLGLVGFLLDAPRPWMRRIGEYPGFPPMEDHEARALIRYLLVTSALIATGTIAASAVARVEACGLPEGVVIGVVLYSFLVVAVWRATPLPDWLVRHVPRRTLEAASRRRGARGVGGPELDGLALVLMAVRLALLAVLVGAGVAGGTAFTVPPGLAICLMLSAVTSTYGFFVFFFPARRFGLLAGVVLIWIATNGLGGPHHRIRELDYDRLHPAPGKVHQVSPAASGLADDAAVLEHWIAEYGPRGPLVVVAADGGGVRAATWIMSVLTQLEDDFQGRFPEQVRFVAGASGGMLGAAYYVGSLQAPTSGSVRHRTPGGAPLDRHALLKGVSQDSLTPLAKRLVLHDLIPGFAHVGPDRGDSIQEAWETSAQGVLSQTVRSLQTGELAGWRPSLVLSPMIVEDGRRLFISNLDLENLATQATPQRNLSRSAIEFARMFQDAAALRLGTAVRMSATFPYVMPAIEIPTSPALRTVDAGYYDEHGVNLAALWLLEHADIIIRERVPRVILIEIPGRLASLPKSGPCNARRSWIMSGLWALTTPVEGILAGRDAVSAYDDDELIEVVSATLNTKDNPDRFQSIAFEPPYEVPECGSCARPEDEVALSWHITPADVRRLSEGMDSVVNRENRARLRGWWARPPAAPSVAGSVP
jgi:hypothetical protein